MSTLFGNKYDPGNISRGGQYYLIGRVTSIVLGEYIEGTRKPNPNYQSAADLGKIDYQLLYSPLGKRRAKRSSDSGNKPAYPMSGFMKQYPVIGEIVLIMPGPSSGLNDNYNNQRLYYFPPYSLWNDSNHNGFPDLEEYADYLNQQANKPGYSGNAQPDPETLPLGFTFSEKFVRNLKPFEGDTILQSRFGQSIRFGSTVSGKFVQNPWSDSGPSGDPITIILNQQGERPGNKFDPIIENANLDGSAIYLTSTQEIAIEDINNFPKRSFGIRSKLIQERSYELPKIPLSNEILSAQQQDANVASNNASFASFTDNTPITATGVGKSRNYSVAKGIASSNARSEIVRQLNATSLEGSFVTKDEKVTQDADGNYQITITMEFLPSKGV